MLRWHKTTTALSSWSCWHLPHFWWVLSYLKSLWTLMQGPRLRGWILVPLSACSISLLTTATALLKKCVACPLVHTLHPPPLRYIISTTPSGDSVYPNVPNNSTIRYTTLPPPLLPCLCLLSPTFPSMVTFRARESHFHCIRL